MVLRAAAILCVGLLSVLWAPRVAHAQGSPPPEAPSPDAQPELPPPDAAKPIPPELPPPASPASSPTDSPEVSSAEPPIPVAPAAECPADWVKRVYRMAHRSVVKVDTGGALGAGFFYPTRRHITTAFHVIAPGHAITVTFYSGKRLRAEVVAIDPAHDLAILELEQPVRSMDVLELTDEPVVELGARVLAIGHPYGNLGQARHRGLLGWSVSQGIISGQGPQLIQTDAALNPGNSGGPLLGCKGKLLGVASAKARGEGVGFAVPVAWLRRLADRIGKQAPYEGAWALHTSGGLSFHGSRVEGLLGFEIGVGLTVHDAWGAELNFHQLWDVALPDPSPGVFEVSRARSSLELILLHRWLVMSDFPVSYVHIGAGGAAAYDQIETERLSGRVLDSTCTGLDCPVAVDVASEHDSRWFGWPLVRVGATVLGAFDLSYAFKPDVTEIRDSVHQGVIALSL